MSAKKLTRREFFGLAAGTSAGALLAACQPQVIEKTVVVKETVQVEKKVEVEKVVTKEVEKEVQVVVTATPPPPEPTEIVFYDRLGDGPKWADAYNKTRKDVTVKVEIQPPGTRYEQLIAAISAGNAPDVIDVDCVQVGRFANLGALAPLEETLSKDVMDRYFQNLLNIPRRWGNFEGHIYGVPWILGLSTVFYNKAMYEEAGGDPELGPQSWDDYITYGKAITARDRIGLAMCGSGGCIEFLYWPWIWAQKGDFVNADWSASTVDSPEVVNTFQFIRDIVCVHKIAGDAAGTVWNTMTDLFTGEKTMMIHGAGGQVGLIRSQFPDLWKRVGVNMIPGREKGQRSSFIGGESVAIATQSKRKQESLDYLVWLTTTDEAMTITGEVGWIPGCPSGMNLPVYKQDPQTAAVNAVFLEALQTGYPAGNDPRFDEVMSPMQTAFANLALCEKPVEEIVRETHEEINRILRR